MTASTTARPSADARSDPAELAHRDGLWRAGRAAACAGAVALVSMLAFESVALAAVMPDIAQALHGDALYALAFGGMQASSVLGMLWAGRTADRQGPAPATAWGLCIFACGLLAAALTPSMTGLVAARAVQGLGGGMLGVALYVGMGALVPARWHAQLFALFAAAWVLPALVGPTVAVALVEAFGWRAVFVAVLALLPPAGWMVWSAFARRPTPPPVVPGAAGAPRRGRMPRGIVEIVVMRALVASAFATVEVYLPLMLNRSAGWSLTEAGLVLSAGGVSWSLGSAWQARVSAAQGRDRLLCAGFVMLAAGAVTPACVALHGLPAWTVVPAWVIGGLGIGLVFPMLSVLLLAQSSEAERGRHAAALQVGDALACGLVLALAAGWQTAGPAWSATAQGATADPARAIALGSAGAFAVAALLACTGAVLAVLAVLSARTRPAPPATSSLPVTPVER